MGFLNFAWDWLKSPSQWHGPDGIPVRVLQHLGYTALSVLIAAAIALPVGLLIGHYGRGGFTAVNIANVWRAIPTLGLLILLVVLIGFSALTWLIPLVALGIPPILVNTYEGVSGVDPDLKDAARGMGMTQWQVLWKVEVPLAVPLILLGLQDHRDLRRRHRDDRGLHRTWRSRPLHHRRTGLEQLRRSRRGRGRDRRARTGRPAPVRGPAAVRGPHGPAPADPGIQVRSLSY